MLGDATIVLSASRGSGTPFFVRFIEVDFSTYANAGTPSISRPLAFYNLPRIGSRLSWFQGKNSGACAWGGSIQFQISLGQT